MRVLVIDDNRDNADLCTMMFRKGGHEVRTAYAGQEGLDIAAEFLPQFVLLDIGMPQLDGFEALARIRSEASLKHLTVVMLSDSDAPADRDRAFRLGANGYLNKTNSPEQFAAWLENLNVRIFAADHPKGLIEFGERG